MWASNIVTNFKLPEMQISCFYTKSGSREELSEIPLKDILLLLYFVNKSDRNVHLKRRKSTEICNVVIYKKLSEIKTEPKQNPLHLNEAEPQKNTGKSR